MLRPPPSYHDLYVTTTHFPRVAFSNLPFRAVVLCSRVTGWQLWARGEADLRPREDGQFGFRPDLPEQLLGGEFEDNWLVLDVDGVVICDGRPAAVRKRDKR